MSTKRGTVAENRMIADCTVVSNVRIRHKEVIVTDPRNTPATFSSPMDRNKFSEDVSLTNYQTTLFPMKFKILWN